MSVAKVIEIKSRSETSFEDAIVQGIHKAGESIHAIREAWVQDQSVTVQEGEIIHYNVTMKVTFLVD